MIVHWDDVLFSFLQRLELYANGGDNAGPPGPKGEKLRAWLRDCPIPTIDQTLEFSRRVAVAHSWYKHLSLFPPGVRFVFLLDPNAGMICERLGDRRLYKPDSDTLKRRDSIGTWCFQVDYYSMPGGLEMHEDPPQLDADQATGVGLFGLPAACFARFTAFLRPTPVLACVCVRRLGDQLPIFDQWARENPDHPGVARYEPLRSMAEGILANPGGAWRRLSKFAEEEGAYQRRHLTESLLSAREAWIQFLASSANVDCP